MKALIILSVALALGAAELRAGEPAWSIEGKAITADSCVVGCPCILGEAPTHGTCEYVGILQIEKGHYGSVHLNGTRLALAGAFGRKEPRGPQQYNFVAYYLDTAPSAEQREALRKILASPFFAKLGQPTEVKEVAILLTNLESFGKVGETCSGSIGNLAVLHVTPVSGAKAGQPIVVQNTAEPMWDWTALGKTSSSYYRAAGRDLRFHGTSGESHKFALSGDSHR